MQGHMFIPGSLGYADGDFYDGVIVQMWITIAIRAPLTMLQINEPGFCDVYS
jgi:hypothetical protein